MIKQTDEVLSSWLVRFALANYCDPLVLSWAIWDKWRGWANDIDRNPGEERLMTLAKFTGVDLHDLNQSILLPVAITLLGKEPSPNELWPWLLTTGARNRLRKGGLQYCVECLKEDKKPYFRREWRYAWHIGCPIHIISLTDCCPHCLAPIEPHRLVAEDREIIFCASCRLNLTTKSSESITNTDALLFQAWTDDVFYGRCSPAVHGHSVSVQSWFEVARYYASFVRRCIVSPHLALQSLSETLNFKLDQNILADVEKIAFEQMNVMARSALMASIFTIMKLPQDELLKVLKDSAITKQGFKNAKTNFPEALKPVTDCLPETIRAKRKPSQKKLVAAEKFPKPRPLWEVNRMWRELMQKMQDDPEYGKSF